MSLRHVPIFVTPWTAACSIFLSSTIPQCLLKFKSTELVIDYSKIKLFSFSSIMKWFGGLVGNFVFEYISLAVSSRDGNGTPLQYSCLENPMDGGAWQASVHGVTGSRHD